MSFKNWQLRSVSWQASTSPGLFLAKDTWSITVTYSAASVAIIKFGQHSRDTYYRRVRRHLSPPGSTAIPPRLKFGALEHEAPSMLAGLGFGRLKLGTQLTEPYCPGRNSWRILVSPSEVTRLPFLHMPQDNSYPEIIRSFCRQVSEPMSGSPEFCNAI